MKKTNKNQFILYSNDEKLNKVLEEYLEKEKISKRIYKFLETACSYDKKIEIEIYETKDEEDEKYIKVCFFDNDSNLYVLCLSSTNKNDLNIVEKITDKETTLYDISLSKKYDITEQNINYLKTREVYNFKFGRLITDNKSFYTIFMGDNIGYQIEIEFINETINYNDILNSLNSLDAKPNFLEFIKIFENIIAINKILFDNVTLYAFKDLKNINTLSLIDKKDLVKKKV